MFHKPCKKIGGVGATNYINGANKTRKYYFPPKKNPPSLIFRESQAPNTSTKHCYPLKISAPAAKNGRKVFDSLFEVFVLNFGCTGKKKKKQTT